jgi:hypothetical protein
MRFAPAGRKQAAVAEFTTALLIKNLIHVADRTQHVT